VLLRIAVQKVLMCVSWLRREDTINKEKNTMNIIVIFKMKVHWGLIQNLDRAAPAIYAKKVFFLILAGWGESTK